MIEQTISEIESWLPWACQLDANQRGVLESLVEELRGEVVSLSAGLAPGTEGQGIS
jgi:hypothetical protein